MDHDITVRETKQVQDDLGTVGLPHIGMEIYNYWYDIIYKYCDYWYKVMNKVMVMPPYLKKEINEMPAYPLFPKGLMVADLLKAHPLWRARTPD